MCRDTGVYVATNRGMDRCVYRASNIGSDRGVYQASNVGRNGYSDIGMCIEGYVEPVFGSDRAVYVALV
jgi:hypothetical protein